MPEELRLGPLTAKDVHLCVDMQRMFAEPTDWHTPWMVRILPSVLKLASAHPERTICTRFVPPRHAGEAEGAWVRYYQRWETMTLDRLDPGMVDLVPALAAIRPSMEIFDKTGFSPWFDPALHRRLRDRGTSSLIISGGETDVCVLATVLGAIDLGYRVVVAADALCSSADAIHDAAMTLYSSRFGQQMEMASTDTILAAWSTSV